MQDINQIMGELWHRVPNSIAPGNNNTERSWGPSSQATYHISPLRQSVHSSTLSSCRESGQGPCLQNATSPFTLTPTPPTSQNLNRTPPYFDVPNFPLPQPYQNSPNPERIGEESLILQSRDRANSPIRGLNVGTSSTKRLTPISRPASRLSWDSGESSLSAFPSWPSQNQEGFIDLTTDSSPPTMSSTVHKRSSSTSRNSSVSSTSLANPRKRVKTGEMPTNEGPQEVDHVDLRDVDDDDGLARILEQQRLASIKAQQEQANRPVTFSSIQCIICMDSMTNITVTHCGECPTKQFRNYESDTDGYHVLCLGHLFCHTCLMEALIAGEQHGPDPGKGVSKCPVCRKKVVRPKDNKASVQVIPLELKVMSKSELGRKKV